jgi:gluconokinase
VFGVAGCGKTTVGRLLARQLGWAFHDADDYHSPESRAKMGAGVPLDDDDRRPWLERLRHVALAACERREGAVIACSALRRSYRRYLSWGVPCLRWVLLEGDVSLLEERISGRSGHYMKPGMLRSQLETFEAPRRENVHVEDIARSPEEIAASIRRMLGRRQA